MLTTGTLYLIPNMLSEDFSALLLPAHYLETLRSLDEFVVENEKNARAFLKKLEIVTPQDQLTFHLLNKHTQPSEIPGFLASATKGKAIGLLSEAGVPCVADPGALVVKAAHEKKVRVVPLVGPSSILLALMASGFNGQTFAFQGYLPIDEKEKVKRIKQLEEESGKRNMTQLFIETPFRNNKLLETLVKNCHADTRLCVAIDLTTPDERILSYPIRQWKSISTDLHKKPAVFLLYAR